MIYKGTQKLYHPFKGTQRISAIYKGTSRVYPANGEGSFVWPHTGDDVTASPVNTVPVVASYAGNSYWQPKYNGYTFDMSYPVGLDGYSTDANGGFNLYAEAAVGGTWSVTVMMEVYSTGTTWFWFGFFIVNVPPYYLQTVNSGSVAVTANAWTPITYTYTINKDRFDYDWRMNPIIWSTSGTNMTNRRIRFASVEIHKVS